jgi:broad specificity phosphatase PhoE
MDRPTQCAGPRFPLTNRSILTVRRMRRRLPNGCRRRTVAGRARNCARGKPPKRSQLNAIVVSTLRDCDYGTWRGSTLDGILARNPHTVSAWLSDPAATPHGGESLLSLMQRVAEWLEGEKAMNRRAILVTHAAVIRAAIIHAIEATPKSFWRIDIAPLSFTRLSGKDGRWNVISSGCAL